jgi:tRNA dimethylallyltransferase
MAKGPSRSFRWAQNVGKVVGVQWLCGPLTKGLVDIPPIPADIRHAADRLMADQGKDALIADLDTETAEKIDLLNPARVQRAWEVLKTTGRGLAIWQAETPAPRLPLEDVTPLVITPEKDWLNARIAARFDHMLRHGALDEAEAMLPSWDPAYLSSKAIGAPELIAHLRGALSLEACREAAIIATRQFAKRQRTWFRSKMKDWQGVTPN